MGYYVPVWVTGHEGIIGYSRSDFKSVDQKFYGL